MRVLKFVAFFLGISLQIAAAQDLDLVLDLKELDTGATEERASMGGRPDFQIELNVVIHHRDFDYPSVIVITTQNIGSHPTHTRVDLKDRFDLIIPMKTVEEKIDAAKADMAKREAIYRSHSPEPDKYKIEFRVGLSEVGWPRDTTLAQEFCLMQEVTELPLGKKVKRKLVADGAPPFWNKDEATGASLEYDLRMSQSE